MGNRPSSRGSTAGVTGSDGYVGTNLIHLLVNEGWTVRAVDARPAPPADLSRATHTGLTINLSEPAVHHVTADVRDRSALDAVFGEVDIVFHLAARVTLATRDELAWDVNVNGAANVAAAARAHGVRMVHCSSVHAFDLARARPVVDETSPKAEAGDRPLYDRSKAAGEASVQAEVANGLDAVIVNPTGIIGPVDPHLSRINSVIDGRKAVRELGFAARPLEVTVTDLVASFSGS